MIVEIDDSLLNDDLKSLISGEGDRKTLDVSKLKSQADIDRILGSKRHVDDELTQLKAKYKDIDVDNYQALLALQLEQNKDILSNPVYKNLESKYSQLDIQYKALESEINKRDQALIDNELKDILRSFKDIQQTAIDDLFYRTKSAGFKKTEKGFLNDEGLTVDSFVESLKTTAKHLFKQTPSSKFNQENINNSLKNNDKNALFSSLNKIN